MLENNNINIQEFLLSIEDSESNHFDLPPLSHSQSNELNANKKSSTILDPSGYTSVENTVPIIRAYLQDMDFRAPSTEGVLFLIITDTWEYMEENLGKNLEIFKEAVEIVRGLDNNFCTERRIVTIFTGVLN